MPVRARALEAVGVCNSVCAIVETHIYQYFRLAASPLPKVSAWLMFRDGGVTLCTGECVSPETSSHKCIQPPSD
jgi:hypothetical protein